MGDQKFALGGGGDQEPHDGVGEGFEKMASQSQVQEPICLFFLCTNANSGVRSRIGADATHTPFLGGSFA